MLLEEQEHPERFNKYGYPIDRTGMDAWSLKMKRDETKKMAKVEALDRPVLRDAEVVVEGHEIPLDSVSKRSTVGKIAHLAAEHGWNVKVGSSSYRTADLWRKEVVVEGRIEEHTWVNAITDEGEHHLSVSKDVFVLDGWPVPELDEVKVHIVELGVKD